MSKWSENQTKTLVKLFLSHKCLWDPEDQYYQMKIKKQEAHHRIINEFYNLTGIRYDEASLRTKIKNMKTTYLQEIKKIRKRQDYTPKLSWFDEWHACYKYSTDKKQDSDGELYGMDFSLITNQEWLGDGEDSDFKELVISDNEEQDSEVDHLADVPLQGQQYNLLSYVQPDIVIDTSQCSNSVQTTTTERITPDTQNSKLEQDPYEDEFDVYAKFLASQLRQLDKKTALCLQMKTYRLVHEARMASAREQSLENREREPRSLSVESSERESPSKSLESMERESPIKSLESL